MQILVPVPACTACMLVSFPYNVLCIYSVHVTRIYTSDYSNSRCVYACMRARSVGVYMRPIGVMFSVWRGWDPNVPTHIKWAPFTPIVLSSTGGMATLPQLTKMFGITASTLDRTWGVHSSIQCIRGAWSNHGHANSFLLICDTSVHLSTLFKRTRLIPQSHSTCKIGSRKWPHPKTGSHLSADVLLMFWAHGKGSSCLWHHCHPCYFGWGLALMPKPQKKRAHTSNSPMCVPPAVETYCNWGEEARWTFHLLGTRLALGSSCHNIRVIINMIVKLNVTLVRTIARAILD